MGVFYQHIGEAMWERDAPESLGTPASGVVRYQLCDISTYLSEAPASEIASALDAIERSAPNGFQIWGLPSGAARTVKNMTEEDHLILLESFYFRYIGKIIHKFSIPLWNLSHHIWGEQRFPIIVLMTGHMIKYGWDEFISDFSYDPNYDWRKLQGRTNSISAKKVKSSEFGNEQNYVQHVLQSQES